MKVILTQDIKNLGHAWDIVDAKAGYVRNHLFPKDLALFPSPENLALAEAKKAERLLKIEQEKQEFLALAKKMTSLALTLSAACKEDGSLYGSIAVSDIVNALGEHGVVVQRHMIRDTALRTLGEHQVELHLGHGVQAALTLRVIAATE